MRIGIDGGGTKTDLILVNSTGQVVGQHQTSGTNPSVVGTDTAERRVRHALDQLLATQVERPDIRRTLLCMAGNRDFWVGAAAELTATGKYGAVDAMDDSLPVLELATDGRPGLVIHAGTGSFVAARDTAGVVHYAGGLGWRLGDPGSGYDIGRRAIARALLELQGWAPPSRLGPLVAHHTGSDNAAEITRFYYQHAEPNRQISGLAPAVLQLAREGDHQAHQLLHESAQELIEVAVRVARKLFPDTPLDLVPTGISGPVLGQPAIVAMLNPVCPLRLAPITAPSIEGVRRLLFPHRGR